MSAFIEHNGFVKNDAGVYQKAGTLGEFNYSDGEQTEILLRDILRDTSDLSSSSDELQSKIVDWPTEYHLSLTRANLLRPLGIQTAGSGGVIRILELGCGCGSISRYLGELDGVEVDAVEGSPVRASLAAMRCRDLTNVTISTANFNQVEFPQAHYDLVLYIGVAEYAGRFSDRDTDQQALQDLLALGKAAAKPNGALLVAIENRLGLKYLLGASEDHYGIPYVGLDDYPDSSGIRTYSKSQWEQEIDKAGYRKHHFIYPFPDYKVPTLMISDASDKPATVNALSTVKSRDYIKAFDLGDNEARLWQGCAEANTLGEHANSFLILMSDSSEMLKSLSNFTICRYPDVVFAHQSSNACSSSVEQDRSTREHSEAQISRLQNHSENLQAKVDIMSNSYGWRTLNWLRRLFGKKTI